MASCATCKDNPAAPGFRNCDGCIIQAMTPEPMSDKKAAAVAAWQQRRIEALAQNMCSLCMKFPIKEGLSPKTGLPYQTCFGCCDKRKNNGKHRSERSTDAEDRRGDVSKHRDNREREHVDAGDAAGVHDEGSAA